MKLDDIKKIAVVGCGTMGNGIAHVAAQHGYEITFVDVDEKYLEKAMATITKNLDRMIKKEKITEQEKADTLGQITTTTDITAVK